MGGRNSRSEQPKLDSVGGSQLQLMIDGRRWVVGHQVFAGVKAWLTGALEPWRWVGCASMALAV